MPSYPRREIVAGDEMGIYHCIARCVRRAFLCGVDPVTGKNNDHRKEWIRARLQQLASFFAIEVCGYAVLSNHFHVVLRVRPDLAHDLSDDEVAIRWRLLFPPRDEATGRRVEPAEHDLNMITSDPQRVVELRRRLASLSWFMRCLNEPIARAANREDNCSGRFWEGRFRSVALLDESAVLACSVYVDLNPIRAGIAETPEESEFTSACDRIRSLQANRCGSATPWAPSAQAIDPPASPEQIPTDEPCLPDAWLCALTVDERASALPGAAGLTEQNVGRVDADCQSGEGMRERQPALKVLARASNRGYLPIELESYLSLLDWTGRELRAGSRGTIPGRLSPILERLGLNDECWLETVSNFGRWFKRAAGGRNSLASAALRSGRRWFQGQRVAKTAFVCV
jgi:REP element-mobilizing transposase RayT